MFTGLVEGLAAIVALHKEDAGVLLELSVGALAKGAAIGDSVAINGCCLTVVKINGETLSFQAGDETLSCTNLGELQPGSKVNIERSLRVGDAMGGHFVTGHIDALGTVARREDDHDWSKFWFKAPKPQLKQMASKGSIAIDGVSLTLVDVTDEEFSVALIPHTLTVTTLGQRHVGDSVNLETDVLAKYVERQLADESGS